MADKKISQLQDVVTLPLGFKFPMITSDAATETNSADSTELISFLEGNLEVGAVITFGTVVPSDATGKNGDVFLKTDTNGFYKKISDVWVLQLTIASNAADGTLLYNSGIPSSGLGKNDDSCLNVLTGIFYLKVAGAWVEKFTMETGPAGSQGKGYRAFSTTSVTIGTGTKVFSTQLNLAYSAGARVRISDNADPTKWMEGIIDSYISNEMSVIVDLTSGDTDTLADWNINIAGEPATILEQPKTYWFNSATTSVQHDDFKDGVIYQFFVFTAGTDMVGQWTLTYDPALGQFDFPDLGGQIVRVTKYESYFNES
jgi:hypothetical protein